MPRGHILSKLLLVVLAVVAGIVFYRAALRDPLFPKRFGVVEEGKVYRSGGLTPSGFERVVREHKIRTIVDLGAFSDEPRDELAAARTAKALGVARHTFNLRGDGTGDPQNYIDALNIITNPASQPVLVHCAAGSQRTGACIMLYRKIVQGVPYERSLDEAKRYDHDPVQNPKLMPYLADHGAGIESAVREAIKRGKPPHPDREGCPSAARFLPEPELSNCVIPDGSPVRIPGVSHSSLRPNRRATDCGLVCNRCACDQTGDITVGCWGF